MFKSLPAFDSSVSSCIIWPIYFPNCGSCQIILLLVNIHTSTCLRSCNLLEMIVWYRRIKVEINSYWRCSHHLTDLYFNVYKNNFSFRNISDFKSLSLFYRHVAAACLVQRQRICFISIPWLDQSRYFMVPEWTIMFVSLTSFISFCEKRNISLCGRSSNIFFSITQPFHLVRCYCSRRTNSSILAFVVEQAFSCFYEYEIMFVLVW